LIQGGCVGTFLLGDLGRNVPLFFVAYGVAFAGYVLAIGTSEGRRLSTVVIWGCVFRATLLLSEPSLSDDVYRYLWDGVVQLAGINPYLYAPSATALGVVEQSQLLSQVNHPDLPTIYPPLAQIFFRLCAWVSTETWSIRLGVCLWDCVTLVFLAGLARSYDLHPVSAMMFFWNPLVLIEGAGQGHIDLAAVSLLVIALLYIRLHGYGRASAVLALSTLTKLVPVLLLPSFWRWAAERERGEGSLVAALFTTRAVLVPIVFTATFVAGYLPFYGVGWDVFGSLGVYAANWEFNAPVFGLLRYAGLDGESARFVLAIILTVVVITVTLSKMPPIQAAFYILGTFLVLTPTLHPWYGVWIVPFLCFYGHRGWIAMSGLVVLAYVVLIEYRVSGVWIEDDLVRWIIPLGSVLVWMAPRFLSSSKPHE
jgi:hypothetical protein